MIQLLACTGAHVAGPSPDTLSTAATAAEVLAALPPADALTAAFGCGAAATDPLGYGEARALWQACDLQALGPAERFAAATGDRTLAAKLHVWLRAEGAAEAVHAPRLLLGEPPFAGDRALAEVAAAPAAPAVAWTAVDGPVTAPPTWGPFPWWGFDVDAPAAGFVVSPDLQVGSIRRLLAAHAPGGAPLPFLVGTDAGLGALSLAVPDGSPATRVTVVAGAPLTLPDGALRVGVADDVRWGDLAAALGPAAGRRLELAMDAAPCLAPPAPGLRCVPGDESHATLYVDDAAAVDAAAATVAAACKTAEVCRSAPGSWDAARETCTFRGLRLPTRWEAERAGFTAGVARWTGTWAGPGEPPRGTCDDNPKCRSSTQRLLTDGSAKAPASAVKVAPLCVTDEPWVATWPPAVVATPFPTRPLPQPPTEAELAIAWGIEGDDLTDKGICGEEVRKNWAEDIRKGGRSTTECRDPYSYVTTNEPDRYLFERFVANAGGVYVGVGSDQSYDFVAEQRPDWAFLYDYDPNVIRFHRIMQALLRHAPTRQDLVALWGPDRTDEAEKHIAAEWPAEAAVLQTFFHGYRRRIHDNFADSLTPPKAAPTFGFLATDDNYEVIHTLAVQKRLVPVPVDLLKDGALRKVGAAAKALHQPVRAFYTSNAPTAWGGQLTPEYKGNVASLPMDPWSVVIATYNWGAWHQVGRWRYDIAYGPVAQRRMTSDGYWEANQPSWDRIPGDHGNLTVVNLPAAWPGPAPR